MRGIGFIALPRGTTACRLAASARQPAVCGRLRALRRRPKATGHIEGRRGRAGFRILFGCLLARGAMVMPAAAENAPRVTDSEIKIGQTMPYTGPGAWLSSIGLAEKAYVQMINDQGGINGRKINLISVDDGFDMANRERDAQADRSGPRRLHFRFDWDAHSARGGVHDPRHAPELSTGRASLRGIHSQAGSKSKNLYPP